MGNLGIFVWRKEKEQFKWLRRWSNNIFPTKDVLFRTNKSISSNTEKDGQIDILKRPYYNKDLNTNVADLKPEEARFYVGWMNPSWFDEIRIKMPIPYELIAAWS